MRDDDLSDEERRLLRQLGAVAGLRTGRWPAHLAINHPDLFPPIPAPRNPYTRRRRILIAITSAIIIVLLVAEATDSLIGNAWLLALITALAALSLWLGYLAPPWKAVGPGAAILDFFLRHQRFNARIGFLLMLFMLALTAWFGRREHDMLDELATLIAVHPSLEDPVYAPSATEMAHVEAFVTTVRGMRGEPVSVPTPRGDGPALSTWIAHTGLPAGDIISFYTDPVNREGWEISSATRTSLHLRRGSERLVIVASENWTRTRVAYSYRTVP